MAEKNRSRQLSFLRSLQCSFIPLLLIVRLESYYALAKDDFVIGGYLPDYRLHHININNTASLLTDLILFSLEPHPELDDIDSMISSCCLDRSHFNKARQAVEFREETNRESGSLRLWMTVGGGGGRSQFFHKAPNSKLVEAIKKLASQEKLNGVDINCEYFLNSQDFERFKGWLTNDAIPVLKGEGLSVSIALHPGFFLPRETYEALDRINLMTYDMPGGGYHASFEYVKHAVNQLVGSGCEKSKIVLGIPAYARKAQNPGLVKTFAELYDHARESDAVIHRDVLQRNEWDGFKFDSPMEVMQKVEYAMSIGLGGVFFWELGQDKQVEDVAPGGYLLEAAHSAVHGAIEGTRKMEDDEL